MSPVPPYLSLELVSRASRLLAQAHLTLFRIQLKFSISNFVLCSTLLGLVADCLTHMQAGNQVLETKYSK